MRLDWEVGDRVEWVNKKGAWGTIESLTWGADGRQLYNVRWDDGRDGSGHLPHAFVDQRLPKSLDPVEVERWLSS